MTLYSQDHRRIAIGTPLGDDALLVASAVVTERLGGLFSAELELVSHDAEIDADKLLSENVTLRITGAAGEEDRYLNGHVASFSQISAGPLAPSAEAGENLSRYTMTVVPFVWLLSRGADCRIFQDQSVVDIVQAIVGELGFGEVEPQLLETYPPRPYTVQYRETTLNFIYRLLEEAGITAFFKHEDGSHKMVLLDDASSFKEAALSELVYRPDDSSEDEDFAGQRVFNFVERRSVEPHDFALDDYDPLLPRKKLMSERSVPPGHTDHMQSVFDYPGEFTEPDHGQKLAKVRLEESRSRSATFRGRSDCTSLTVGRIFQLDEHPRPDFNGGFVTTSVTTRFAGETGHAAGQSDCQFTAVRADVAYRPPRTTPKPIVQGPQTATVVGPAGEEIYVDPYGRIKVQFRWDRYGTADENSSLFVRVAKPMAGRGWGFVGWPSHRAGGRRRVFGG